MVLVVGLLATACGTWSQPAPGPMPGPPGGMPPQGMPADDGHDHEEGPLPLNSVKGHFELVDHLLRGLTLEDSAKRARSAFCLGQVGKRSATKHLAPLLNDPSRAVRFQAGIALCRLGDASGLGAAGAALTDASEWIRYYAVEGMAGLEAPRAKELLEASTTTQSEFIGKQIADALDAWPWPTLEPEAAVETIGPFEGLADLYGAVADTLIVESDGYWHKGEYIQCARCNSTGTFLDPTWVEGYSLNGWLLWSLGDNTRSLKELRAGIAANEGNWEAWFNMGQQLSVMNEPASAIRFFEQAVKLGAPAINSRQYCHALEKAGHPDLALEAWQELYEKHPTDPIAPRHIKRLKEGGEQV